MKTDMVEWVRGFRAAQQDKEAGRELIFTQVTSPSYLRGYWARLAVQS